MSDRGPPGYRLDEEGAVVFGPAVRDSFLERLGASISDEQRAVLESGRVEFGDCETAIARTIECGEAKGYTIHYSVSTRDGFRLCSYEVEARDPDNPDPLDDIAEWDLCYDRHFKAIDIIWQTGHSELREKAESERWTRLIECLAEHSIEELPRDLSVLSGAERSAAFGRAQAIGEAAGVDCFEITGWW